MYIARNKSLDEVFKVVGKKNLYDFNVDELEKACELLKTYPVWNTVKRNGFERRVDINKPQTIDFIEKTFIYSIYMDQAYWNEALLEASEDMNILDSVKGHTNGNQTFEIYANNRIGIYRLKPNETAEVRWTKEWLKEVFGPHPISKFVEVKDEDGMVVEFVLTTNEKGMIEKTELNLVDPKKMIVETLAIKPTTISEKVGTKSAS